MINPIGAPQPPDYDVQWVDDHPEATLRVHGEVLHFDDMTDADRLASTAQAMATCMHIVHDRNHVGGGGA